MDKSNFREELEQIKETQKDLDERIATLETTLDDNIEPEETQKEQRSEEEHPQEQTADNTTTIDPIKWLGRVGILITVLGVGFFIAYAIEIGLIGYLTRILIGVAAGTLLIGGGHYLHAKKDQHVFSQILTTGGFILTYFSIFSSYFFDNYRDAIGTTLLITSILLGATIISMIAYMMRYGSSITTSLGLLLGYITTFLSGPANIAPLIYLSFLTIAGLYVTTWKSWTTPLAVTTASTYLFSLNAIDVDTFYTLPFAILTALYLLIKTTTITQMESYTYIILSSLNSLFYLIFTSILLYDHTHFHYFTLALAGLHVLIYLWSQTNDIQYTSLSTSLGFLLIYSLLDLTGIILTITWIALSLLLAYAYTRSDHLIYLILSYIFAALTFLKSITYDLLTDTVLQGLLQESTIMIGVAILGYIVLAYIHHQPLQKKIVTTASIVLLPFILFIELDEVLLMTAVIATAILLRALPFKKTKRVTKIASFVFLPIAAIQGIILLPAETTQPVSNAALAMAVLSATTAGFAKEENNALTSKILGSGSLAILLLTIALEVSDLYITIGWGLTGLGLTAYGVSRETDWTRKLGLFTFTITVLKLFLYDTQGLSNLYKTVAYITLGVMLLISAYVYSNHKNAVKE